MMQAVVTKRILLIDPDPHHRSIAEACLKTLSPWQSIPLSSGADGLTHALADPPDAILMEGILPDMSLVSFLGQLRSHPATATIPVIFLTSYVNLTEQHRFQGLGAIGAIAKPYDPLLLVPKMAYLLGWSMQRNRED
jgi:CheY-like chemotaxis protein